VAGAGAASKFVGRWKLVDEKGRASSFLTLTDEFTAKRDHVPNDAGRWEVIGEEARITYEDGWLSIMRLVHGGVIVTAYSPVTNKGLSWDKMPDKPTSQIAAVRETDAPAKTGPGGAGGMTAPGTNNSAGPTAGAASGVTPPGKTIYTGPRGGQYYISLKSGKNVYVPRK
jgi:hypothetical protein